MRTGTRSSCVGRPGSADLHRVLSDRSAQFGSGHRNREPVLELPLQLHQRQSGRLVRLQHAVVEAARRPAARPTRTFNLLASGWLLLNVWFAMAWPL